MATWNSDSAAGSTSESGAGVQTLVSWRTAADTVAMRRRRWLLRFFRLRRRRMDMGEGEGLKCAWKWRVRECGGEDNRSDMSFYCVRFTFWGVAR